MFLGRTREARLLVIPYNVINLLTTSSATSSQNTHINWTRYAHLQSVFWLINLCNMIYVRPLDVIGFERPYPLMRGPKIGPMNGVNVYTAIGLGYKIRKRQGVIRALSLCDHGICKHVADTSTRDGEERRRRGS